MKTNLLFTIGFSIAVLFTACKKDDDNAFSKEGESGGSISLQFEGNTYNFSVDRIIVPDRYYCENDMQSNNCYVEVQAFSGDYLIRFIFNLKDVSTGEQICSGGSNDPKPFSIDMVKKDPAAPGGENFMFSSIVSIDCNFNITKNDIITGVRNENTGARESYPRINEFEATFRVSNDSQQEVTDGYIFLTLN